MGGLSIGYSPGLLTSRSELQVHFVSWFALRTRSRHEKVSYKLLQAKGVTAFLPTSVRVHRWSDRQKRVELPLFPGYVFVRISPEADRLRVLQTPGIVSFVGVKGHAWPVPAKQIEDLQAALSNNVPCQPYPYLRIGQRVRIRGGCLDGVEGIFERLGGGRTLIISVDSVQGSVAIHINGYDVEPV